MEVHAHTYTARKKFAHYLWEFLMLFLAVFCGFLAEYQLEHIIENQREKSYIRTLLEETKKDIIEYNSILEKIKFIRPVADSLYYNVKNAKKYNYNLQGKWNLPYTSIELSYYPTLTTIEQLKYSGNLRLIKDINIQQQIIAYEIVATGRFTRSGNNVREALKNTYSLMNAYCDQGDLNVMLTKTANGNSSNGKNSPDVFEMLIITRDKFELNKLANSFVDFRAYLYGYENSVTDVKQKAAALAEALSKKYHLH